MEIKRTYYANGNLEYERHFINNKRNGITKWWYLNGDLAAETRYVNDKMHGFRWVKVSKMYYMLSYFDDTKHGIQIDMKYE